MSRMNARPLLVVLILGLVWAGILPQTTEGAKRDRPEDAVASGNVFSGESRVTVVEVPVNVTDRSGTPVRGLGKENFRVIDEGENREITDFEVIDLAEVDRDPRVIDTVLPGSARRHILLLFDVSFSAPTAIVRAREAARDFVLKELHPTDLVAVGTYSLETGPRLVLTFTTDRAQIAHAIDSLGYRTDSRVDPLRFIISNPRQSAQVPESSQNVDQGRLELSDSAVGTMAIMEALANRDQRNFQRGQVIAFTRSLGVMGRQLGSLPGRKQVVFFSEGFDSSLVTGDPIGTPQEGDQRAIDIQRGVLWQIGSNDLFGDTGLQRRLRDMVREFNRTDTVIQAVDIGGLRAEGDIRDSGPINRGHEGLFYIANETGGQLFKDANDLESQLGDALDISTVTYVLTFRPENLVANGKFRRLRVELVGDDLKGAEVSHRQGYYAPRPFADLDPLEKELIASNAIVTGDLEADFELGVLAAPFRANKDWAYVPVIVEIDGPSLLAGGIPDDETMALELYAYATNKQGEMKAFFTRRLGLDLDLGRELISRKGIKYYGHLELVPGDYQLRVLVRNMDTGQATLASRDLTIPEYEDDPSVVLPPFFIERPGQWLMIREQLEGQSPDSTIYPFTINGDPYVPAAQPDLNRGQKAHFALVAYNLGKGRLNLEGTITTPEGKAISGGQLALLERTTTGIEGYDKLLARLDTAGLDPGEYELQVGLTDPATGRSESNSIAFRIRK